MECDDARWRADGVRHQILLRVLPAQRHDVLGPMAVLRMSLGLLRRQLLASPPGIERALDRMQDMDQQLAAALAALSALRCWDGADSQLTTPASAAAVAGALVRTPMSLRGHRLQHAAPPVDGTQEQNDRQIRKGTDAPGIELQPALFAALGLLLHALDSAAAPTEFTLLPADWELLLLHRPAPGGGTALVEPAARPVHRQALNWLLDDLGCPLSGQAGQWRLRWPAARANGSGDQR